MIRRLHHVGIVTSNIDNAVQHYVKDFGCPAPKIASVERPGVKLRTAMLSLGSGTHLQLIEPSIGLGVAELQSRGEGAIIEMAFEVDDIESFAREKRAAGATLTDLLGNPIEADYLVAASGNRYVYLAKDDNLGTSIELIEVRTKS
jgi:catechol 2,3-dioxygenase-like lactoylglutathione lyase family enzyme